MGQYYSLLVIDGHDNTKTLTPCPFGYGFKLMEHSWIGNSFVNAAYAMIQNNPCRVAWIGDYADDPYDRKHDLYAEALPHYAFTKYYKIVWSENEQDALQPEDFTEEQLSLVNRKTRGTYLINHSRESYLDLGAYIQCSTAKKGPDKGWCVNPLPLLTACGNGRGGGDFSEDAVGIDNVGLWAFNELEYSDKTPQGYLEESFRFMLSE